MVWSWSKKFLSGIVLAILLINLTGLFVLPQQARAQDYSLLQGEYSLSAEDPNAAAIMEGIGLYGGAVPVPFASIFEPIKLGTTLTDLPRLQEKAEQTWKDKMRQALKRAAIEMIKSTIVDFISGETSGKKAFIDDWGEYLSEAADGAIGEFLNELFGVDLCADIEDLNIPQLLQEQYYGLPELPFECTLSEILQKSENIFDRTLGGGWGVFYQKLQPNNNAWGVYMQGQSSMMASAQGAAKLAEIEGTVGQGFLSVKDETTGKIATPGIMVKATAEQLAQLPVMELLAAKEWNEILTAAYNALYQRIYRQGFGR